MAAFDDTVMFDLSSVATAVVAALQKAMPPWISLTLRDEMMVVCFRGSEVSHVWLPILGPHGNTRDIEKIGFKALWDIQDEISLETREPWPLFNDSRRNGPLAHAEVQGECLRMWFGELDGPTLQLPPLPLERFIVRP